VCEEPSIQMRYSDDLGASWSPVRTLSVGGDNYFPNISSNPGGRVVVAWYTHRYDPRFHNRQDVELAELSGGTAAVVRRMRVTTVSNETEADPLLGPFFIGDYFETFTQGTHVLVHLNANYRSVCLLGKDL